MLASWSVCVSLFDTDVSQQRRTGLQTISVVVISITISLFARIVGRTAHLAVDRVTESDTWMRTIGMTAEGRRG